MPEPRTDAARLTLLKEIRDAYEQRLLENKGKSYQLVIIRNRQYQLDPKTMEYVKQEIEELEQKLSSSGAAFNIARLTK